MTPDDRRCILDSEAATEALSFLLDLKNRYHVTPDVAELAGQSQNRMFLSGVIGMTLGVSGSLQSLEKQCGRFDWDIAPLPRYREQAGRIGTANWVVPAGSAHPQMAWELLTFLAGTDGQRHLMKRIGLMPSVAEILESGEFEELMPRRNLQTLIDAISYGRPGCRFYYWAQVRRALEPGFERLWLKETTGDVASELAAMTREANALIQAAENEESAVRRSGEQMEQ